MCHIKECAMCRPARSAALLAEKHATTYGQTDLRTLVSVNFGDQFCHLAS